MATGRDTTYVLNSVATLSSLPADELRRECRESLAGLERRTYRTPTLFAKVRTWLMVVFRFDRSSVDLDRIALAAASFKQAPANLPPGSTLFVPQVEAAVALLHGRFVQMDTGEGKTYAILAAAFALACRYERVFIVCANDYLAHRDASRTMPFWNFVGLDIELMLTPIELTKRVVYTTLSNLSHQRVRDDMDEHPEPLIDPARSAVILDEVDAVVLDQASTNFVSPWYVDGDVLDWTTALGLSDALAPGVDLTIDLDPTDPTARLTAAGNAALRSRVEALGLTPAQYLRLRRDVELAYVARDVLLEGRHYVVDGNQVYARNLIDGTIERGTDYDWLAPLRQHLGLPAEATSVVLHRRTGLEVLREFDHMSGMSGTTVAETVEYLLTVSKLTALIRPRIPRRQGLLPDLFASAERALDATIELALTHAPNRPMLIATLDIPTAHRVHQALTESLPPDIEIILQTGEDPSREHVFERAGRPGVVIVSTQVAGRGVDIKLTETARSNMGMFLLCLGHAPEARHDRQFLGRAGRQGDPYTAQFINTPDDPLVRSLPSRQLMRWVVGDLPAVTVPTVARSLRTVQRDYRRATLNALRARVAYDAATREIEDARREWLGILRAPVGEAPTASIHREAIGRLVGALIRTNLGALDNKENPLDAELAQTTARLLTDCIGEIPSVGARWLATHLEGRTGVECHQLIVDLITDAVSAATLGNASAQEELLAQKAARDDLQLRILQRVEMLDGAEPGVETDADLPSDAAADLAGPDLPIDELRDVTVTLATKRMDLRVRRNSELGRMLDEYFDVQPPNFALLTRVPISIARWTIRRSLEAYLVGADSLREESYHSGHSGIDHFRFLARRSSDLWKDTEAELAANVIRNLMRAGDLDRFDEVFLWADNRASPLVGSPKATYSLQSRGDTAEATRPPDREMAARLVETFVADQEHHVRRIRREYLVRLLADFLDAWPLARLRSTEGAQDAFERWSEDDAARSGGRLDHRHLRRRRWVLRFLRFLHERGHAAAPPSFRGTLRGVTSNVRRSTRELGSAAGLTTGVVVTLSVALAVALLPTGDPVAKEGIPAIIDQLLVGGLLRRGSAVAPVLAGVVAAWALRTHLSGREDSPMIGLTVEKMTPLAVQVLLTAVVLHAGIPFSILLLIVAAAGGRLLVSGVAWAESLASCPWLSALWLGISGCLLASRAANGTNRLVLGLAFAGLLVTVVLNTAVVSVISAFTHTEMGESDGRHRATRSVAPVRTAHRVSGRIGWLPHVYSLIAAFIAFTLVGRAARSRPSLDPHIWEEGAAYGAYVFSVATWTWQILRRRLSPSRWADRLLSMQEELDSATPLNRYMARLRRSLFVRGFVPVVGVLALATTASGGRPSVIVGLPLGVILTSAFAVVAATAPLVGRGLGALVAGRFAGSVPVVGDVPDRDEIEGEGLWVRLQSLWQRVATRNALIVALFGLLSLTSNALGLVDALGWLLEKLRDVANWIR